MQLSEFRFAIAYLILYAGMFDAFSLLDGGSTGITDTDDNRISFDEWMDG